MGRSTTLLGESKDACGQAWHLPAGREPITSDSFVRLACELAGRPSKLQVAPR